MAKKSAKFEARLNRLGALLKFEEELTPEDLELVENELLSKNGFLIKIAFEIVEDRELRDFIPQMFQALNELMDLPYEADPGCDAKGSLLRLLIEWEKVDIATLFRGVRFRQMEPVWARERVDTAGRFRALCAQGLVTCHHSKAGFEVARLLADPVVEAREGAVEASSGLPGHQWEMLLRHKIYSGDIDPRVVLACFDELAHYAPETSMDLFEDFIHREDYFAEGAALAMGTARQPEAFGILRETFEKTLFRTTRLALLQGIALLRTDESFEYLIDLLKGSDSDISRQARRALEMYEGIPEKEEEIQQAIEDAGL